MTFRPMRGLEALRGSIPRLRPTKQSTKGGNTVDKYAKLFKGLEMCAGPDCSTDCPYHGETRGGKTCRAWLLNDALVAIANKEAENQALAEEVNRIAVERDKLNENMTCIIRQRDDMAEARDVLRKECTCLHERCQIQQNEINALALKLGEAKTEKKPEPGLTAAAKVAMQAMKDSEYWHGQADALKWYLHDRFEGCAVEGCADVEPETEATGHV